MWFCRERKVEKGRRRRKRKRRRKERKTNSNIEQIFQAKLLDECRKVVKKKVFEKGEKKLCEMERQKKVMRNLSRKYNK